MRSYSVKLWGAKPASLRCWHAICSQPALPDAPASCTLPMFPICWGLAMADTIKKLTIEGFKSIRKLEDFELGGLNVLIGANGAGKSNFVSFFRLLRDLIQQRLQTAIAVEG